jgi:hypothetical protein
MTFDALAAFGHYTQPKSITSEASSTTNMEAATFLFCETGFDGAYLLP